MLSLVLQTATALAVATAPTPPARPIARAPQASLAADFGAVLFMTAGIGPSALSVSASQRVWWPAGFELDVGFRALLASQYPQGAAIEGFGRIGVAPAFGAWRPRVALELGLSAANHLRISTVSVAPGNDLRSRAEPSALYVQFEATPIRFQFGSFSFAVFSIAAGTDVLAPGRVLRVQANAIQLAWRFL